MACHYCRRRRTPQQSSRKHQRWRFPYTFQLWTWLLINLFVRRAFFIRWNVNVHHNVCLCCCFWLLVVKMADHPGYLAQQNNSHSWQRKNKYNQMALPPVTKLAVLPTADVPELHRRGCTLTLLSQNSAKNCRRSRRKRVTTASQRIAANLRERRRMTSLNGAFADLRSYIPKRSGGKRYQARTIQLIFHNRKIIVWTIDVIMMMI